MNQNQKSSAKGLKYIGDGSFRPGVPARDLSPEEAESYDRKELIKSGLYIEEPEEVTYGRTGSQETPQDTTR